MTPAPVPTIPGERELRARWFPPAPRRWGLALAAVALGGLVVRLTWIVALRGDAPLRGDPLYYHGAANLLADGVGLLNPFAWARGEAVPAVEHPPAYVMYLAAWSVAGAGGVTAHLVATAALGVAAVVAGGLAGREVAGPTGGLVAAAVLAFHPGVWRFDGVGYSETLAVAAMTVVLWATLKALRRPAWGPVLGAAGAGAVAALTRAELILVTPLLVAPVAVRVAHRLPWPARPRVAARWRPAAAGIATVGVAAALIVPWSVWASAAVGDPVLISNQLGITLAGANCDAVYHPPHTGAWHIACATGVLEAAGLPPDATSPEAQRLLTRAGLEHMAAHPGRLPVVVAARVGRVTGLWWPRVLYDYDWFVEGFPRPVAAATLVVHAVVAVAAVAGFRRLRSDRERRWILAAPVLIVVVAAGLTYGSTRFRASAEPSLAVLAGAAVAGPLRAGDRRRTPDAAIPAAARTPHGSPRSVVPVGPGSAGGRRRVGSPRRGDR